MHRVSRYCMVPQKLYKQLLWGTLAPLLDPHAAAELSIDDMAKMVDEMIIAHGPYMAMYK